MTRIAFSAALLLGFALASCDTAPSPATPDAAAAARLGTAEPDASADAPVDYTLRAHADPALFLQPGTDNTGWYCYAEPCWFAVDFTVPAGAHWTITEVAIEGLKTPPSFYNFDGFSFRIHADDNGAPAATPLFTRTNAAFTEGPTDRPSYSTFGFDVSGASAPVLAAGTYWLSFDMVNEAAGFQQAFLWRRHLPAAGRTALVGDQAGAWSPLGGDQDLAFDLFGYTLSVDVKPGSADNPVNPGARGRLPVAVLTTDAFDAATLDPATLTLGDGVGAETPVARRRNGTVMAALEDVDGDGDLDLVLHVEVSALVANGDLTAATTRLVLSATTTGGTPVRGADAVRVVPAAL